MSEFLAERAALNRAANSVATIRQQVVAERDRIGRKMDDLLNEGWKGTARNTYASAWAEWAKGAQSVIDGLDEMAKAIHASLATYVTQDESSTHEYRRAGSGLADGQSSLRV